VSGAGTEFGVQGEDSLLLFDNHPSSTDYLETETREIQGYELYKFKSKNIIKINTSSIDPVCNTWVRNDANEAKSEQRLISNLNKSHCWPMGQFVWPTAPSRKRRRKNGISRTMFQDTGWILHSSKKCKCLHHNLHLFTIHWNRWALWCYLLTPINKVGMKQLRKLHPGKEEAQTQSQYPGILIYEYKKDNSRQSKIGMIWNQIFSKDRFLQITASLLFDRLTGSSTHLLRLQLN